MVVVDNERLSAQARDCRPTRAQTVGREQWGLATKEFCLNRPKGHAGVVLRAAGCCDAFDEARSKDDEKPQSVISNQ